MLSNVQPASARIEAILSIEFRVSDDGLGGGAIESSF